MPKGQRQGATDGEGENKDERANKDAGPTPTRAQEHPVQEVGSFGKDAVLGDPETQSRTKHQHH